jgi:serine/threonine protein kinase
MNVADFQASFPDYTDLRVLRVPSGQKDVAAARRGGQDVAIKVFRKLLGDEDKRAQRELAAVAKLKSDYVPAVVESGVKSIVGEDRYFIVEQFISGTSYDEVLRSTGTQPLDRVIYIAGALLQACVDFASVNLVHRDLKPANLIVDSSGKLWVIDFGFCRHLDLSTMTPTGGGVGTPGYCPLEQLRQIPADINVRADLFAAGVILYESLTGKATP